MDNYKLKNKNKVASHRLSSSLYAVSHDSIIYKQICQEQSEPDDAIKLKKHYNS